MIRTYGLAFEGKKIAEKVMTEKMNLF